MVLLRSAGLRWFKLFSGSGDCRVIFITSASEWLLDRRSRQLPGWENFPAGMRKKFFWGWPALQRSCHPGPVRNKGVMAFRRTYPSTQASLRSNGASNHSFGGLERPRITHTHQQLCPLLRFSWFKDHSFALEGRSFTGFFNTYS